MSNAIILHGKPDPGDKEYYNPDFPAASNSHWIPWLQKQLLVRDIYAQTPEIPDAWQPEYSKWVKEFERYDITPETVLVGHSCGSGFLVRWLSEHPDIAVGTVILVAPWLDPAGTLHNDFFDFTIDPNLPARCRKLLIMNSDDDDPDIQTSVQQIRQAIPGIGYRELHGYKHFCYGYSMKTLEFPQLLEECAKK